MGLMSSIGIGKFNLASLRNDASDWINGRKSMDYQNKLNVQNWEMENAYNTPAMQMARYKDAGLNPNLIYGQQNTGGHISGVSGGPSGADILGKIGSFVSMFYGIKDMKASIANKQQQNALLASQADYVKEQTIGVALENSLKRKTLGSLGPNVNPNDPWYIRDIKNSKIMNKVVDTVGSVSGWLQSGVDGPWTVRYDGNEYTATSQKEAMLLLDALNRKGRKNKLYEKGDRK